MRRLAFRVSRKGAKENTKGAKNVPVLVMSLRPDRIFAPLREIKNQ